MLPYPAMTPHIYMPQQTRREFQRAALLALGRQALALFAQGVKPKDAHQRLGASHARMYRAIRMARARLKLDPLLS